MRLIDADALVEQMESDAEHMDNMTFKLATYAAINDINHQPTIDPQKWIPVSERLPEEGERVLCTHLGGVNPNRQVIEHIYQNGEFVLGWDMDMTPSSPTFGQRYMGKVIAWMPLPEPWKGEEE